MMLLNFLAGLHLKTSSYPVGGLQRVVDAIEQRYRDLGGEIHFKSRVAKILVENNKAVGVRLEDGTEHRADVVISAADGRTTIFDMLEGKYINDKIRGRYDNPALFPPIFFVSLGVLADIKAFTGEVLMATLVFIVVAIITKLVGCGVPARLLGMSTRDSLIVGFGMAPRGEVAMIVALLALNQGVIEQAGYVSLVIMSLVTTLIVPLVLRNWLYRGEIPR